MSILSIALIPSLAMLMAAVAVVAWRMLKGPGTADRLVAMDMLGLVGVALCVVAALLAGHTAFLDVALGVALVAFLGTAAFAGLIEKTAEEKEG